MRYLIVALALVLAAGPAAADKASYLELARRGWGYELRRQLPVPVHISGRYLRGSALCLIGERPQPETLEVLDAFRALLHEVFGKPVPMRYAGPSAQGCGTGRVVVLRLYSGFPPNRALTEDMDWMNDVLDLGFRPGQRHAATTPALAQTFFGQRGQGTHIMVGQADGPIDGAVEAAFFRSILVEELFQSFTFGMDIIHLDRSAPFQSKLEEFPINLLRLPWSSDPFMRALLGTNPVGLCEFDLLMLHAVAEAPVAQTTDPEFLDYIDSHYEALLSAARATMARADFAPLLDPDCTPRPL